MPAKPVIKMTRLQVKERALNGEKLVIFNKKVLKLDSWIKNHPGGVLPILHLNGNDATVHITAFHPKDTLKLLERFIIATVDHDTLEIDQDWLNLHQELSDLHYFDTDYSFYYKEFAKFVFLYSLVWSLVVFQSSFIGHMASALILASIWQQMSFVAHDGNSIFSFYFPLGYYIVSIPFLP